MNPLYDFIFVVLRLERLEIMSIRLIWTCQSVFCPSRINRTIGAGGCWARVAADPGAPGSPAQVFWLAGEVTGVARK
jgi:hypothetical protein